VLADLDGRIDVVLDGGPTTIGVESTVLDVGAMAIYRPGAVTAAMISRVAGAEAKVVSGAESAGEAAAPETLPAALPSPGMGMRHYAPRGRLVLVRDQREMAEALATHAGDDLGVFLPDDWKPGAARIVFRWGPWGNAEVPALHRPAPDGRTRREGDRLPRARRSRTCRGSAGPAGEGRAGGVRALRRSCAAATQRKYSALDWCIGDYESTENERHLLHSGHTSEKWRSIERWAHARH